MIDLVRLESEFADNFTSQGELGASFAVWQQGKLVLDLAGGFQDRERTRPWNTQTRVLIWSATKGLASACLLHACAQNKIDLHRAVSDFWPEYGCAGKEMTSLLHVLSHRAGQSALRDREVSILDHAGVCRALERQEPFWRPGTAHGYHARTYGFLVDEILRRVTGGTDIRTYFRKVFGDPLDLNLWIGLPESLSSEVAPVQAPRNSRLPGEEDAFYRALADPDSLSRKSFATPAGLGTPSMMNDRAIRSHSIPSLGGIGTAESLARFYGALSRPGLLPNEMLRQAQTSASSGMDRVLLVQTAFSAGFMQDPVEGDRKIRTIFGPSREAFGQPGAGGSHAFADPQHELAFAYVMNQMEPGLFPNFKSKRLIGALYANHEKQPVDHIDPREGNL